MTSSTRPRALALTLTLTLTAAAAASAQSIHVVTEVTGYTPVVAGRVAGPATAVVEATLHQARLDDYRIDAVPWARAWDIAQQRPDVLIYLIARTPEREALFKWVGEITRVQYHFYKLRSSVGVEVRTLADAKGYRVGVTRGDVREDYLRRQGFVRLVVSAQNDENFRKLVGGQVQLIPLPDKDAEALCREQAFDCGQLEKLATLDELSMNLYMAYSPQTADAVVARTRAAFERVKADGTLERAMGPAR